MRFLVAAAVLTLGVSSGHAQDDRTKRVDAWRQCLADSYNARFKSNPDLSLVIETAFVACKTEEDLIYYPDTSPALDAEKLRMRGILKQQMLHPK